MKRVIVFSSLLFLLCSCAGLSLSVNEKEFGYLSDGTATKLYTLTNSSGASLSVTDYGARIVSLFMPDRDGKMEDVIVGPGDIASFEKPVSERFFGCILGRYANRISQASFTIDGTEYKIEANENRDGVPVHCHGGAQGFDRFVWESTVLRENRRVGIRMHRMSPDRESGFPGNCDCSVTYWLTEDNVVELDYEASTDAPTVINLSNHSFFNLHGARFGSYVMEQLLQVDADYCIQNNPQMCPDIILPVEGTPFDFREPHRVDYRIDQPCRHLELMHGMSACWCIRDWDGTLRKAADLYDPRSGRGVETWTTEPALLTYTARGFDGSLTGKYGPVEKFTGMCLETMHYADSPNQERFPSTVLRPGQTFRSTTQWRFYAL